jgi:hypothetical protein
MMAKQVICSINRLFLIYDSDKENNYFNGKIFYNNTKKLLQSENKEIILSLPNNMLFSFFVSNPHNNIKDEKLFDDLEKELSALSNKTGSIARKANTSINSLLDAKKSQQDYSIEDYLGKHIYQIRQAINKALKYYQDIKVKKTDFGKEFISRSDDGYCFNADVEVYDKDKNIQIINSLVDNRNVANYNLDVLINLILKYESDNNVKDFFFSIFDNRIRLPFYYLGNYNIKFPIKIKSPAKYEKAPNRKQNSMVNISQITNQTLYNGKILRLISVKKNTSKEIELEFTTADFFEIIDSCDYLDFHLKALWGSILTNNNIQTEKYKSLSESDIYKEWKTIITYIKNNTFENYHAGMGFSLPIFQINKKDKSITLLAATGSTKKVSGAGLKQICPAGLLEINHNDNFSDLNLDDLQTIITKEFIEEALLSHNEFEKFMIERVFLGFDSGKMFQILKKTQNNSKNLENQFGDMPIGLLKRLINYLLEENNGNSLLSNHSQTVLKKIYSINPQNQDQPCFIIVDAFCGRPDFILPIYVYDEIDLFLNWEFEEKKNFTINFEDFNSVENFIIKGQNNWTPPGLAGIYFGAKYYFDNLSHWNDQENRKSLW